MRDNRAAALSGAKIKSLKSLEGITAALRKKGKKVVFTNGCFDILHYGHVKYLQEARRKGDCLVVAVNSDSSVKRIKGEHRPINTEGDRLETVAALGCVDFALLFNEDTPLQLIRRLKPQVLVKGSDWDKQEIVGASFVRSYGGKVATVRLISGRSTSRLIEKIVSIFSR